ncbi:hypothetical protein SAMN05421747_101485 [Parapedobacter composti]|uniref:LTXXQ motif family protein n=1 Tax=Parapedobacter composti TaxID=623281 RepID=A0A1I1EBU7_9SPHI|nr:hypothetical protein [Parapedobacter composti]SFB84629.1 hypothetical protein SAMN05421747_101485 [Parapedobacter composti]
MTVKKQLNLIAIMLLSAVSIKAQETRAERFERIETEKIAFITRELNLTPSEAQKFFPIYNQYFRAISRLRNEKRGAKMQGHNLQNKQLHSNGFNPGNRDVLAFDAKELEVKKNYRKRFADVIGHARASRFFEVEEEFKNYLLRELQHRRRDKDHE